MSSVSRTGAKVAGLLGGSWRAAPPPVAISESDLLSLRKILLHTGSAALAWWRIRQSSLRESAASQEFREAFRLYSINATLSERRLTMIVQRLRAHGIEPILAKGWAIAREYPQPGLRPYGDFDLCVPPDRCADAEEICAKHELGGLDVHPRFRELTAEYGELLLRSRELPIGQTSIRILSPEDHFRLLAIHALFHGVWKPLWLCDIALLMESQDTTIDWELCLSGEPKRSEWVMAAIALAHEILGARLPDPISSLNTRQFPRWLFNGLRMQWGQEEFYMNGPTAGSLIRDGQLVQLARGRWPNPIQATVELGARINRTPRIAIQVADVVMRIAKMKR